MLSQRILNKTLTTRMLTNAYKLILHSDFAKARVTVVESALRHFAWKIEIWKPKSNSFVLIDQAIVSMF